MYFESRGRDNFLGAVIMNGLYNIPEVCVLFKNFDGFVILHGTDTLAYTASALSFMLENLGKTVIVTGSQIPIFESRSDGRDNFLGAFIMAGLYNIPEVCVFFNNKLYRGNRTTKRSTGSLDAFYSPNSTPLANFGIDVHGEIFSTENRLFIVTNWNTPTFQLITARSSVP